MSPLSNKSGRNHGLSSISYQYREKEEINRGQKHYKCTEKKLEKEEGRKDRKLKEKRKNLRTTWMKKYGITIIARKEERNLIIK